jgi:two-component system chemotaxis response regulator CheB
MIAVVLTGLGRNGAGGVRRVKQVGGTVIAQDEATSRYFSMPQAAIATGAVDSVLPLGAIAPALIHLTANAA